MTDRYVVLADVVDSRDIPDREAFHERLEDACAAATATAGDRVVAAFEPVKGVDEVVGVLSAAAPVYDVVEEFRVALHPEALRVVVARGRIDVGAETDDPAAMDGPAFHRGDELMEELLSDGRYFLADLGAEPVSTLLSDEVELLQRRKREWTDRQRTVIELYEDLGSQAAVADRLDVSQPAVSRALERADWALLQQIEERLRSTLARYE